MDLLVQVLQELGQRLFEFLLGKYIDKIEQYFPGAVCPRCGAKGSSLRRSLGFVPMIAIIGISVISMLPLLYGGAFVLAGLINFGGLIGIGYISLGLLLIYISAIGFAIMIIIRDNQKPISCNQCKYRWH